MDQIDVEKLLAEAESMLLSKREIYQQYGLTESEVNDVSRFSETDRRLLEKESLRYKRELKDIKDRSRRRRIDEQAGHVSKRPMRQHNWV